MSEKDTNFVKAAYESEEAASAKDPDGFIREGQRRAKLRNDHPRRGADVKAALREEGDKKLKGN